MRWAVQRSDELLEKELRMKWSFGREMNQRLWAFRLRRMYREGLEPWAAVPFSRSGLPIGVQIAGLPFAEEMILAAAEIVETALSTTGGNSDI